MRSLILAASALLLAPVSAFAASPQNLSYTSVGEPMALAADDAPVSQGVDASGLSAGQKVRDAAGHLVGRITHVAPARYGEGSGFVVVRGVGGTTRSVKIDSLWVNGDAWMGGPEDLQDARMLWY